jgi:CRP/FNR family transcriptional regulator
MVERMVAKNEMIWLEQDHAKMIYIVASGLIKLFKMSAEGKEQILRLVRPGDCFGYTGIFNGGSNPESAQAVAPTVLYALMKSDLETLLWQQKQLAHNTIRALATEMHHYISLVEDLALKRVCGRLARILIEYSSEEVFDNSLIRTRGDLAAMTGTVREVVAKSLKQLEENGVISSNGRYIIIRDRETLKTIAGLR